MTSQEGFAAPDEFPLTNEEVLEKFALIESELLPLATGYVATDLHTAFDRERNGLGQHTQRYMAKFSVPTTAYRRDAVYPTIRRDMVVEPKHYYVHVPTDVIATGEVPMFWMETVDPKDEAIEVFSVSQELGARIESSEAGPGEGEGEELTVDAMLVQAIDAKSLSINTLRRLIRVLRDEHETRIVPFLIGHNPERR